MNNEKAVLERILNIMLANVRPSARRFYPTWLASTAACAGNRLVPADIASKRFRPSIFFKVIATFIFGAGTVLSIREAIVNPQDKLGLIIFISCLLGSFFVLLLYQFFLNKKLNFSIFIDASGIRIGGDTYQWAAIKATGILTKGTGRSRANWLLIATGDGTTYKTYPLRLFMSVGGFPAELSKYVEHFKQ